MSRKAFVPNQQLNPSTDFDRTPCVTDTDTGRQTDRQTDRQRTIASTGLA